MKLTEEIGLTHHEYGSASHHNRKHSISNKSIDEFIAKLKEKGITIDQDSSEKKISYYSKRKSEYKEATVPLGATLPKNVGHTLVYFLQGTGTGNSRHVKYDLELKNYSSTGSSGNRIGGSVEGEYGITCKLTIEGNEIDVSIVDKVEKALHETYLPPLKVMSDEVKKALADFQRQIDEKQELQKKK